MKTLSKTPLYEGKWRFLIKQVLLSNGVETDVALVEHPGSVVLIPVKGDQIVMLRQFRPALGHALLELPAGTLEWGEDALHGAQRELREETGYRAETLNLLSEIVPSPGVSNERMQLVLARDLVADPLPMDADEQIEVVEMPAGLLKEMALSGQISDAKSIVGILHALTWLDTQSSLSAESSSSS